MSIGLDTFVVIRLLTGELVAAATQAQARLLAAHRLRQQVIVSDVVLAEAYHALKYHYDIEPKAIRQTLLHMLSSGMVQAETGSAALAVLSEKLSSKAGFVDRLIQARYHADQRSTWTLDQAKLGKAEFIGV